MSSHSTAPGLRAMGAAKAESYGATGTAPLRGGAASAPDTTESAAEQERKTFTDFKIWGIPSFAIILPVFFLEMVGMQLLRAVIPRMESEFFGDASFAVSGNAFAAQGAITLLCAPVYGTLSDRYGRKWMLVITTLLGNIPNCVPLFTDNMVYYEVAFGLSGLFKGTLALSLAYVADLSHPKDRASIFGLLGVVTGLSVAIGPLLGGLIAERVSRHCVFQISTAVTMGNMVFVAKFLPESLPANKRNKEIMWHKANPLSVFRTVAKNPVLNRLLQTEFLAFTAFYGLHSSIVLYLTRDFQFTEDKAGLLISIIGIGFMVSEGVLLPLLVPHLGEVNMYRVSLVAVMIKLTTFGFAKREAWIWLVCCTLPLVGGFFFPCICALSTNYIDYLREQEEGKEGSVKQVDAREEVSRSYCDFSERPAHQIGQGELQGALAGTRALAEGIGPLVAGNLLTWTERQDRALHGMPYLVLAGFVFLGWWLSFTAPVRLLDEVVSSHKCVESCGPCLVPGGAGEVPALEAGADEQPRPVGARTASQAVPAPDLAPKGDL